MVKGENCNKLLVIYLKISINLWLLPYAMKELVLIMEISWLLEHTDLCGLSLGRLRNLAYGVILKLNQKTEKANVLVTFLLDTMLP